jgi:hypothetical protein
MNTTFDSQLDGGPQVCFHLQGSSGQKVLVHGAWRIGRSHQALHSLLAEIIRKVTALCHGQFDQFIDHIRYQLAHPDFLQQLGMVGSLKQNAGGEKCYLPDHPVKLLLFNIR